MYKNKYLKYKAKYLSLKELSGGSHMISKPSLYFVITGKRDSNEEYNQDLHSHASDMSLRNKNGNHYYYTAEEIKNYLASLKSQSIQPPVPVQPASSPS